jgi:PAS domain S-box-containing protein
MPELDKLLDHLEASGADVFVPYFAGEDQLHLLTRFAERGLKSRMAVAMGHFDEVMASRLPAEVREGLFSCNTYFMSVDTPENRALLDRLAHLPGISGVWPHGDGQLTNFGEATYLCVKAFAQAANQAGSLDAEALVKALETIALRGPQGEVTMDPSIHHAKVNSFLARSEADGTFTIVERFGAIAPVLPERYRRTSAAMAAIGTEDMRLQSRILQQIAEAVFLIDARAGTILYANPATERMFGYAPAELLGQTPQVLLRELEMPPEMLIAEINRDLNQKGTWQHAMQMYRKDGTPLWCSVSVSSFTHPRVGEVWLVVHQDITELIRLTEEISRRSAELETMKDLAQMKEHFLSTVSHEMKTPLSLILGYAELLQDRLPEEDALLEGLMEGARRLTFQINKLVDCSALLSGTLPLYPTEVNLNELVGEMRHHEARRFSEKSLSFITFIAPDPMLVRGDPKRICQMVYELLDNARRFTPAGGAVTLKADVAGDFVRLSVIDTGDGLPPEIGQAASAVMTRPSGTGNTTQSGLGLGLMLVRRLAELHGGRFEVESTPGEGSRFSILLPRLPEPAAESHAGALRGDTSTR